MGLNFFFFFLKKEKETLESICFFCCCCFWWWWWFLIFNLVWGSSFFFINMLISCLFFFFNFLLSHIRGDSQRGPGKRKGGQTELVKRPPWSRPVHQEVNFTGHQALPPKITYVFFAHAGSFCRIWCGGSEGLALLASHPPSSHKPWAGLDSVILRKSKMPSSPVSDMSLIFLKKTTI